MSQESWMGMVGDEITADVRAVVQGTSEDRDAWRRTAIKAEAEIERLRAEWRMSDDGRIKAEETVGRLSGAMARALERCEVADDPSGAADEAAAILRQVVSLDGTVKAQRSLADRKVALLDVLLAWGAAIQAHGPEAARPLRESFERVLDDVLTEGVT